LRFLRTISTSGLGCSTPGIRPGQEPYTKFIFGSTLVDNRVGKIIYEDFLLKALAKGRYITAPEPHVIKKGLENIPIGFDIPNKGVSAKKVAITF